MKIESENDKDDEDIDFLHKVLIINKVCCKILLDIQAFAKNKILEESPNFIEEKLQITSARSNPRESATENYR